MMLCTWSGQQQLVQLREEEEERRNWGLPEEVWSWAPAEGCGQQGCGQGVWPLSMAWGGHWADEQAWKQAEMAPVSCFLS